MWLIMAILSAVFAGLTAILAKCGIRKTDSDLATALRTIVVLLFSWIMVFLVGSAGTITSIGPVSLLFLVLSGLATGMSWICYFKALSLGDVNKVVPIDKSSTILTVLLAIVLFKETENLAAKLAGTALLAVGIFLMIDKKQSGKLGEVKSIDKKELAFIALSGLATGASWLCYYYAIQQGVVSVVVPIDKLSIVVTVLFSRIVFKEKLSKKAFCGLILMIAGTLAMAVR